MKTSKITINWSVDFDKEEQWRRMDRLDYQLFPTFCLNE